MKDLYYLKRNQITKSSNKTIRSKSKNKSKKYNKSQISYKFTQKSKRQQIQLLLLITFRCHLLDKTFFIHDLSLYLIIHNDFSKHLFITTNRQIKKKSNFNHSYDKVDISLYLIQGIKTNPYFSITTLI